MYRMSLSNSQVQKVQKAQIGVADLTLENSSTLN
jgi:hypothetical protein